VSTNHDPYTAVVLVGGRAQRLGGADKTRLDVGGRPIIDRVLDAVSGAERVVLVGQREPNGAESDRVRAVCEQPPGGGPVAGLAAAVTEVDTDVLVLLAGDLPFLEHAPDALLTALRAAPDADAVVPVDDEYHLQPLTAAYRSDAIRARLASLGAASGVSMRTVLSGLNVTTIAGNALGPHALVDVDTTADLTAAREHARIDPHLPTR
jgi:molybdopterin-guanine dinucleotide biosynthesis protein A